MKFKTVSNDEYIVNVELDTTFTEIKRSLQDVIGEENINISFMARGKIINTERTVNEEGLDNNSTVIIVIRKQPIVHDEIEPMSNRIILNIAHGSGYEKAYTGEEIKQYLTDPFFMTNIMHMLGGQNPFLLSYIGVNPRLAYTYILDTLDNPEFRLVVKCDCEDNDPIKPLEQKLKKDNEADENNVKYIVQQCEDDRSSDDELFCFYVKGLYLSYNRDVVRTIDHFKK